MTKFSEELEKILKNFTKGITAGYKNGFNFETYPEENYEYAILAITELVEKIVPEEKYLIDGLAVICSNINDAVDYGYEKGKKDGFNSCRAEMLRLLEE